MPVPRGVRRCKVRFKGGRLQVPWADAAECLRSGEKKPLFNASWASWRTASQRARPALPELPNVVNPSAARPARGPSTSTRPPACPVQDALPPEGEDRRISYNERQRLMGMASYQERPHGLVTGFVQRKRHHARARDLRQHSDLYKDDLKSFDDRRYRELGGRLQTISKTSNAHARGVWVEIVTRSSRGSTRRGGARLTSFWPGVRRIRGTHRVPPGLKMTEPGHHKPPDAPRRDHRASGDSLTYAGNVPGTWGISATTHATLRRPSSPPWVLIRITLHADGAGPRRATRIPGRWRAAFEGQRTGVPSSHDRSRLPVL